MVMAVSRRAPVFVLCCVCFVCMFVLHVCTRAVRLAVRLTLAVCVWLGGESRQWVSETTRPLGTLATPCSLPRSVAHTHASTRAHTTRAAHAGHTRTRAWSQTHVQTACRSHTTHSARTHSVDLVSVRCGVSLCASSVALWRLTLWRLVVCSRCGVSLCALSAGCGCVRVVRVVCLACPLRACVCAVCVCV